MTVTSANNEWGQFVMIDVEQRSLLTNKKRFKPVLETFFEYNKNEYKYVNKVEVNVNKNPLNIWVECLVKLINCLFCDTMLSVKQKISLFCNK